MCTLSDMNKQEHAARLRAAMGRRNVGRAGVAGAANVEVRTVTNWTTGQTMPSEKERVALRKLLGSYDDPGDPVEVAVRDSDLEPFRQTKVIGYYQEQLHEQRRERGA